jgi:hypothetical protein
MKILTKLLFIALLATTAGVKAAAPGTHKTFAIALSEARQVGSFKGISVSGAINAIVKIGNEENVRLEGDQDAIAQLVTEVKDGILTIRPKTKWMDWNKKFNNSRITAYISAKHLTSVTMSGSGSIDVQNTLNETELTTTLSGSGSIKVAANVSKLTAILSGSGNIDLNGKANQANLTVTGSGNVKASAFTVETATTKISGSGSIYIHATQKIEAVTVGSGSVYYSGNPNIETRKVGSGGVKKI